MAFPKTTFPRQFGTPFPPATVLSGGDTVAPTVVITTANNPAIVTPVPITITFSEAVTGFTIGDLTIGGTAAATAGNFSGSGAVYTCDLTPVYIGTITVDINADVCTDAAGNGNEAATQLSITALSGESVVPNQWLKSSDASTLFQDNAKTTPATALNDPIGCWADKSANGNDVISAADINRPLLKTNVLGGKNGILWDGSNDNLQKASYFDSSWDKSLGGIGVTNRSDYSAAGNYCAFGDGSAYYEREINATGIEIRSNAGGINVPAVCNHATGGTLRHIFGWSYDGIRFVVKGNRSTSITFTSNNMGITGNLAIGSLASGGFTYNTHIFERVEYKKGISLTSLENLFTYAAGEYGLTVPSVTQKIVFLGDSLTYGTGATSVYVSWGNLFMANQANGSLYSYIIGTPGYSAQAQVAANPLAVVTEICDSDTLVFLWLGSNDLAGGRTAAQTWADLTTLCNAISATGASIVLTTIIARGTLSAPQETERGTLNTNIATNYATIADYLLDLAADARFQNASDTTYYNVDTIHLNDTGYGVVEDLATAVYGAI